MLVNSPKFKRRIFRNLNENIKQQMASKSPLVQGIKRYFVFEGDKMGAVRSDGTREVSEIQKYEAMVEIKRDEIGPGSVGKVADDLSTQLADAQSKAVIETLRNAVQEVGNTVDGKGTPFSPDLAIEALDKILIDFEGEVPRLPTIVCSPEQMDRFKSVIEQMMTVEPYKSRYEAVIKKKKKEFDEREANRKLVD